MLLRKAESCNMHSAGNTAAQYARSYGVLHLLIHYGADFEVPITDKEMVEACLKHNMYARKLLITISTT